MACPSGQVLAAQTLTSGTSGLIAEVDDGTGSLEDVWHLRACLGHGPERVGKTFRVEILHLLGRTLSSLLTDLSPGMESEARKEWEKLKSTGGGGTSATSGNGSGSAARLSLE